MVKCVGYAVYDCHGGFTRYSRFQSVLDALSRDGFTLDSEGVRVYFTKVGVMIVDCYGP